MASDNTPAWVVEDLKERLRVLQNGNDALAAKYEALNKQFMLKDTENFQDDNSIEVKSLIESNDLLLKTNKELHQQLIENSFEKKELKNKLELAKSEFEMERKLKEDENKLLNDKLLHLHDENLEIINKQDEELTEQLLLTKRLLREKEEELKELKMSNNNKLLIKQLNLERSNKNALKEQLNNLVAELESKLPLLDNQKNNLEVKQTFKSMKQLSDEKNKLRVENNTLKNKLNDSSSMINQLVSQRMDLANQLKFLLINKTADGSSINQRFLTDKQIHFIQKITGNKDSDECKDYQKLITENLVEFQDINSLQERNLELLTIVRSLSDSLYDTQNENEKFTIKEAKQSITSLKDYNEHLEEKLNILQSENDQLNLLLDDKENIVALQTRLKEFENSNKIKDASYAELQQEINSLKNRKKLEETQFNAHINSQQQIIENLQEELRKMKSMNSSQVETLQTLKIEKDELAATLLEKDQMLFELQTQLSIKNEELANIKHYHEQISNLGINRKNISGIVESQHGNSNSNFGNEQLNDKMKFYWTKMEEMRQNYKTELQLLTEKLNTAQENLLLKTKEYNDLLSKTNGQIKWLQDQLDTKLELKDINVDTSTRPVGEDNASNNSDFDMIIQERDQLRKRLEITINDLKISRAELNTFNDEIKEWRKNNTDNFNAEQLSDQKLILDELKNLNQLKQQNKFLNEQNSQLKNSNNELHEQLKELNVCVMDLKNEIASSTNDNNDLKTQISKLENEIKDYKVSIDETNIKHSERISALEDQIKTTLSDLESTRQSNVELEDRFNRLKKQAHEKLDASKSATLTVTNELNELKKINEKLTAEMNNFNEQKEIAMKELNDQLAVLKEIESTLTSQNEKLQRQLEEQKATKDDSPDMDKIKEEWEQETLKRIDEAKEKWNTQKVSGDRVFENLTNENPTDWEKDMEAKVKERAEQLNLSESMGKSIEEIQNIIREQIKSEINGLKKKAFEEGKQQASMKTTLLQRKITKLESQLNGQNNNAAIEENTAKSQAPKNDTPELITNSVLFNQKSPLSDGNDSAKGKIENGAPLIPFGAFGQSNSNGQSDKNKNGSPFINNPFSLNAQPGFSFGGSNAFQIPPKFGTTEPVKNDTDNNKRSNEANNDDTENSKKSKPV